VQHQQHQPWHNTSHALQFVLPLILGLSQAQ